MTWCGCANFCGQQATLKEDSPGDSRMSPVDGALWSAGACCRSQMLTYTGKVAVPCHQSQHEHRQLSMLLSALAKPSPEVWGAGASSISEAE